MSFDNSISIQESIERREKFAVAIKCDCKQVGTAFWEENINVSPEGPKRLLVEVSSGFYMRVLRKDVGRSEIVCGICDSVVRD